MKIYKKVYIASKVWHAPKIRAVRASIKKDPTNNLEITSRWIDMEKDHPIVMNDKAKLWDICHNDVMAADIFVLYSEPGDEHRGALVELGTAYACKIPVYAIGSSKSTIPDRISDVAFTYYPLFHTCPTPNLDEGMFYINAHQFVEEYL
jgi:nucleoside 2-deoxyribosyltransferase